MKFQCLITIDCPDADGFSETRIIERHVQINSIIQETLQAELDAETFPGVSTIITRRFI